MRVAVVGMLGRQEKEIDQALYPNLNIRFANNGTKYGLNYMDLLSKVDRIFVMTKFVSHALTQNIDRSKAVYINGGFGRLKESLATLNATANIIAPASIAAAPPKQEEDDVTEKFDFNTPMKNAKVGDVLSFARPPKVTLAAWETRVMQMRSYNKRKKGIHSEQVQGDGKIDVLITKIATQDRSPTFQERVLEAKQPDNTQLEVIPRETSATPVADSYFWQKVFVTSMEQNPGMLVTEHARRATEAYRTMIKETT